ncbi:VOC family protein [Flavobacterium sp.]|uniref:SMU1112c/YaeR family gloxylase I-like metalloprotein n=1 Tax=Flavobacterium sp. TaxID=239 RepID=UPI003A8E6EAC
MLNIKRVHHIAIICSDYQKAKHFYTNILGFTIEAENYREDRQSYKLDLSLNNIYTLELFSFPNPPQRVSRPEAAGLRHIAFETDDINKAVNWLSQNNIATEPIRTDEFTGKKFTFLSDPDNLPIELYEM